jgi:flagellar basal body-associated protein FliL
MTFIIIIVLIIALILLAVGVNAIQQHKQKQEQERRQRVARYRNILEESEALISNVSNFPVGKSLVYVLYARARDALNNLVEETPGNKVYKERQREYQEVLTNLSPDDHNLITESFQLPENDKQVIALIQALKKLRAVLKSEHARGRIDSKNFQEEDHRMEFIQLRINVETLERRADSAYSSKMMGSARQYYEKALVTLKEQSFSNDYVVDHTQRIEARLETIAKSLREENSRDAAAKANQVDELDELFQPKKKW